MCRWGVPGLPMVKFCTLNDTVTGPAGREAPTDGLVIVSVGTGLGGLLMVTVTLGAADSALTNSTSAAVASLTITWCVPTDRPLILKELALCHWTSLVRVPPPSTTLFDDPLKKCLIAPPSTLT